MKKQILIIDDAPTILLVLENIFNKEFDVVKKGNGQEALDWIESGHVPYIIISDVVMPVFGGFELITKLNQSPLYSQIPVFVLSNTETSSEKVKFLKLGVIDYILKPFNPEEVYWKVYNLSKRIEAKIN